LPELHAARRVSADDPGKSPTGDDELLFALKRKWDDGTTHVLFSPTELIARLAAIVPPKAPFKTMPNGVRYHGVLAPRSRLRPLIVPRLAPSDRAPPAVAGSS